MPTLWQMMLNPGRLEMALHDCQVTRWAYREAVPSFPRLFRPIPFERGDGWDCLRRGLSKKAGCNPDNHETYLIVFDGEQVCLQFTDWRVAFGSDVVVGRW